MKFKIKSHHMHNYTTSITPEHQGHSNIMSTALYVGFYHDFILDEDFVFVRPKLKTD